ncbi:MAG: hypothetical protein D3924_15575, partial [Candidatus Electrothrix sp. AR4]|nr:hypothetical protein [Candidatus Electrothrix sp. AR4]
MAAPSSISIRDQGALDLVRFLLLQGLSVRIKVSGESMRPLLTGGEIVEILPFQAERVRVGEIFFLCVQQDAPLMHRLIRRRYFTKNPPHTP